LVGWCGRFRSRPCMTGAAIRGDLDTAQLLSRHVQEAAVLSRSLTIVARCSWLHSSTAARACPHSPNPLERRAARRRRWACTGRCGRPPWTTCSRSAAPAGAPDPRLSRAWQHVGRRTGAREEPARIAACLSRRRNEDSAHVGVSRAGGRAASLISDAWSLTGRQHMRHTLRPGRERPPCQAPARARRGVAGAAHAGPRAASPAALAQVLLAWSPSAGLSYVGQMGAHERTGGHFHRRMEHLMCYLPGAALTLTLLPGPWILGPSKTRPSTSEAASPSSEAAASASAAVYRMRLAHRRLPRAQAGAACRSRAQRRCASMCTRHA